MQRTAHLLPIVCGALLISTAACGGSSDSAAPSPVTSVESSIAVDDDVDTELDTASAASGDNEAVCAELQVVQDLSNEVTQSVNDILESVSAGTAGSEQETLQAFVALGNDLEAGLPELLGAYERAAAAALPEVAEEIRAVADGTAALTPALADGFRGAAQEGEFVDLEAVLGDADLQAAGQRAGLASLRLDNFTNPVCGFQFSDS